MVTASGGSRSRTQRLALEVLGWTVLALGIAAIPLPGPGLLILALGLWILSLNYTWAEKLFEPVQRQAMRTAADSVKTWPRIVLSTLGALWLVGLGTFWGLRPDAPSWWPVDDRWWLVGGWATGGALIVSGLLALTLLVYSLKHFRYGQQDVEVMIDDRWPDDD